MRSSLVAVCVLLAACATAKPSAAPTPAPSTARSDSTALPPVPLVEGALKPTVVYPVANTLVESRDSNFIFGAVGNGHATLTINGAPVQVHPNGAYLAFISRFRPPTARATSSWRCSAGTPRDSYTR